MSMDYHEVLPIGDKEFPDLGDVVMVGCQASENSWFTNQIEF